MDHKGRVRGLSFSPDGSFQLVSASNDCTLKFWDLNLDGNMYKTLKFDKSSWVLDCKWSPNGKQIAAVGCNKHVSNHAFVVFCCLFSKLTYPKNSFRGTIRVSKSLDSGQDRHSVGPDLDPYCLQRLSADEKSCC